MARLVTQKDIDLALSNLSESGHITAAWVIKQLWARELAKHNGGETPEQEGVRHFVEGRGLSELWGSVSHANFRKYQEVLDAFSRASKDSGMCIKRADAIRKLNGERFI